ncbi:MAG: cation:dicarboxylate symporter family transporter [Campylobacteraceae bacterium]
MHTHAPTYEKKKKTWVDYTLKSLVFWVIFGITLGIILGYIFPEIVKWKFEYSILGGGEIKVKTGIDIFIKVLKWLVGPIIFLTIILGIVGLESLKEVGSIGFKAFIYFEIVSTIALAIGILFGNVLAPGVGMNVDVTLLDPKSVESVAKYAATASGGNSGVLSVLKGAIPNYGLAFGFIPYIDVVSPFLTGKTLQVLVMALVVAILLSAFAGKYKAKILKPLEIAQDFFFVILKWLMWFSPVASFCAMAFLIGTFGIGALINMGGLLLVMLASCLVFIFVVLGAIMYFFKISIFKFMYYIHKELLIVFATSSSESALAPLMRKLEGAGVSKGVTGLVLPTGYSFNLDCTNIYLSLSIIFLAQAVNVNLSLLEQLGVILILMVTSKGAVGVTGSGFIVLAGTLSSLPQDTPSTIPVAAVAILLGVDKFMSEMRAVGNLCGNAVAAVVVGAWDKQIDMEKFKYTLDNPETVKSVI